MDSVAASFETGFLNPSMDAWDGAQWIGASLRCKLGCEGDFRY